MKRTSILPKGLIILLQILIMMGCAFDRKEYQAFRQQKVVEKGTPHFNPAYFKDMDSRHLAVFFDISDGILIPSERPAEARPGLLPYRSPTAGNVLIVYKNLDGKVLGQYAIDDPMLFRSCDSDSSWVGETKPIESGTIEILLPYDETITTVEIGRIDGKPIAYKVGTQILERVKIDKED